jgi:hypothetical protein
MPHLRHRRSYIEPGSPGQHRWLESFNARLREAVPDRELCSSLAEASLILAEWLEGYNPSHPDSSLGMLPLAGSRRPGGRNWGSGMRREGATGAPPDAPLRSAGHTDHRAGSAASIVRRQAQEAPDGGLGHELTRLLAPEERADHDQSQIATIMV